MTFRGNRRGQPPAPKPYTLIDLPTGVQVERRMPAGHDALRGDALSGRIELQIEALSPVHVGSGLIELTGDGRRPLVREMVRVQGVPVVLGSSFKGCVRSIVEAISASCVRVTKAGGLYRELGGCRSKDQLCVACRIFGAPNFQGLVRFSDLRLIDDPAAAVEIVEVPQFFQPRTREQVYYRGSVVRGRKFFMHGARQAQGDSPVEVCRTGSRFGGAIDFTNLQPDQLGLLLVALGQDPRSPLFPKLGGAKPACYGSVRVELTRLTASSGQASYWSWDTPEDSALDPARYIGAAGRIILMPQLSALVDTLRWPNDRECPSGNY